MVDRILRVQTVKTRVRLIVLETRFCRCFTIAIELNVTNIRNSKSSIFQLKHVMSNVFSTYIFEMLYNSKK